MTICGKCRTDITCGHCKGSGKITVIRGLGVDYDKCPVCGGWGYDRNHKCPSSKSSRVRRSTRNGSTNITIHNKNYNR